MSETERGNESAVEAPQIAPRPRLVSRWVDQRAKIWIAGSRYRVGPTFVGESVEVVIQSGLVEILHTASSWPTMRSDVAKRDQGGRCPRPEPPRHGPPIRVSR
jgi:hypothetical protein